MRDFNGVPVAERSDSHELCGQSLVDWWAKTQGVEVTFTELPPMVENIWTRSLACPHGVTLYFEPTSEQKAEWIRMQTP